MIFLDKIAEHCYKKSLSTLLSFFHAIGKEGLVAENLIQDWKKKIHIVDTYHELLEEEKEFFRTEAREIMEIFHGNMREPINR